MSDAPAKVLTSRELAVAISDLIDLRINMAEKHWNSTQAERDTEEVLLRTLADAFKRLDHNPGVYCTGPKETR